MPGKTRRGCTACAAATAVVLLMGGACASDGDAAADDAAASAAVSTTTTMPPTTSTTALPVPTVPPPPPMRGVASETVLSDLRGNGFDCAPSPDFQADGFDIVDCSEPTATAAVRTYATTAGELVAIEGFTYVPDDSTGLVHAATVAWEGADPAAAQAWVEATVASGQVRVAGTERTTIGGQRLVLSNAGIGWTIVVGTRPPTT